MVRCWKGCFVFDPADMPRFFKAKREKTPLFEPDSLSLLYGHHGELRRFPFRAFLPLSGIPAGWAFFAYFLSPRGKKV